MFKIIMPKGGKAEFTFAVSPPYDRSIRPFIFAPAKRNGRPLTTKIFAPQKDLP
jgi:hypothetical protein